MGKHYCCNPPKSDKCFGVEIEGFVRLGALPGYGTYWREFFVADDGSIIGQGFANEESVELISHPLEYHEMLEHLRRAQIGLPKGFLRSSAEAGTHVHVGRGICSIHKAQKIAVALAQFPPHAMHACFGRAPTAYCKLGLPVHHAFGAVKLHEETKQTVEFRSFAAGDFAWAAECVRRTKLLCEMPDTFTPNELKEQFGVK